MPQDSMSETDKDLDDFAGVNSNDPIVRARRTIDLFETVCREARREWAASARQVTEAAIQWTADPTDLNAHALKLTTEQHCELAQQWRTRLNSLNTSGSFTELLKTFEVTP